MSIRNHAFGHPPTDDTLKNLAKGAVAGGVELGEFVVDVDGDGADRPTPQLERAWDAWQAERYKRGEISQLPGYTDNPFRPR